LCGMHLRIPAPRCGWKRLIPSCSAETPAAGKAAGRRRNTGRMGRQKACILFIRVIRAIRGSSWSFPCL
jgi:hypothetical protein